MDWFHRFHLAKGVLVPCPTGGSNALKTANMPAYRNGRESQRQTCAMKTAIMMRSKVRKTELATENSFVTYADFKMPPSSGAGGFHH